MTKDETVAYTPDGEAPLSPNALRHREFPWALLGYQPTKVNAFLEQAANMMESLIDETRELKAQQDEYEAKLDEYHQIEGALRSALITSQKFGESIVDSAKHEADNLIESARLEKNRIQAEAELLPAALTQEIAHLQELRDRLRSEIMAVLAANKSLLETIALADGYMSGQAFSGRRQELPAGGIGQTDHQDGPNSPVEEETQ